MARKRPQQRRKGSRSAADGAEVGASARRRWPARAAEPPKVRPVKARGPSQTPKRTRVPTRARRRRRRPLRLAKGPTVAARDGGGDGGDGGGSRIQGRLQDAAVC